MSLHAPQCGWHSARPGVVRRSCRGQRGLLITEVVVAMAIVVATLLPLAYSITKEHQFLRACYDRAVAMEIVDGEMELLVAGEWRVFQEGTQPYPVHAEAATNLPPGRFELTLAGQHLRLEWRPEQKDRGGKVVREATLR